MPCGTLTDAIYKWPPRPRGAAAVVDRRRARRRRRGAKRRSPERRPAPMPPGHLNGVVMLKLRKPPEMKGDELRERGFTQSASLLVMSAGRRGGPVVPDVLDKMARASAVSAAGIKAASRRSVQTHGQRRMRRSGGLVPRIFAAPIRSRSVTLKPMWRAHRRVIPHSHRFQEKQTAVRDHTTWTSQRGPSRACASRRSASTCSK